MVKRRYTTNIFILKIKLHNYILYKEKKDNWVTFEFFQYTERWLWYSSISNRLGAFTTCEYWSEPSLSVLEKFKRHWDVLFDIPWMLILSTLSNYGKIYHIQNYPKSFIWEQLEFHYTLGTNYCLKVHIKWASPIFNFNTFEVFENTYAICGDRTFVWLQ